jgi:hypothetical protein
MLNKARSVALALAPALLAAPLVDGAAAHDRWDVSGILQPVYVVADHPVPTAAQHLSKGISRSDWRSMSSCRQIDAEN